MYKQIRTCICFYARVFTHTLKDMHTSIVLCKQIFALYQKGIYKFARF